MRKLFIFLLAFAMLFGTVPAIYAGGGDPPVLVYVDGNQQIFSDAQPVILDGRTLVPIRSVAEVLGAQVDWKDSAQTVLIDKGDKHIELIIGSKSPTVNGSPMSLDAPAVIMNGRTMVPLRFVSEALGAKVVWDGTVKIYSDPSKAPADPVAPQGTAQLKDMSIQGFADFLRQVYPNATVTVSEGGKGVFLYHSPPKSKYVLPDVSVIDSSERYFYFSLRKYNDENMAVLENLLKAVFPKEYNKAMAVFRESIANEKNSPDLYYEGRYFCVVYGMFGSRACMGK